MTTELIRQVGDEIPDTFRTMDCLTWTILATFFDFGLATLQLELKSFSAFLFDLSLILRNRIGLPQSQERQKFDEQLSSFRISPAFSQVILSRVISC